MVHSRAGSSRLLVVARAAEKLCRVPTRRRPLVLLVEDNQTQLDLYELVVGTEYATVHATRGKDALELASEQQPDVIVMDVMLPDVDGLEVCRRLHAHPQTAHIPILVLTGNDDAYARAQATLHEVVGVLMKPCPAERLMSSIQQAIERARVSTRR